MSWNWKVIWLTSSWLLDWALCSLVVTFLLSFLGWLVVERLLNEPSSQGVRMLLWSMKVFGESDSHIFDLMWLNHLIKRLLPSFVLSVYWELLTELNSSLNVSTDFASTVLILPPAAEPGRLMKRDECGWNECRKIQRTPGGKSCCSEQHNSNLEEDLFSTKTIAKNLANQY